ncbi:ribonuclease E activity regulator RraA [Quisquiliibacterium transsilvanicum]|jgi:regulator of ribonuclease activity A|uniref:4-hydroxy-4-methyl-2-oxoglutarate aldolase n=1 Tax=Quisquiliibacterium transsilvanicum TaxID=1549638 RepID=A0A7W8HE40_9BURK|nr:ribonuclease E activity regulator RraA [Quisquiliibacterium transsilvanicum]MBB5270271.1 regulator of ribonuclease activity A [Quisquiliibacterium transsilvanicum]
MQATTDLCDANENLLADGSLRVLAPLFQSWGAKPAFAGPVSTLRCFEDNSLVRTALEEPGEGRVLVVDGGGSLRCALLGGNLAQLADRNGWAGVIVNGCVRDADEIDACAIGIRALAAHPRKSDKRGIGQRDVVVEFAGSRIAPGHWCYADRDGVLVADRPLAQS